MNLFALALGSVLLLAPVAAFAAEPPPAPLKLTLAVGDKAPDFRCSRWIKNGPVDAIKPGQAYVVEFWATWCGPCKLAIPHLTEMSKEYQGKVTFIGVDIMERGQEGEALDKKVDAFVKTMGEKMDYPVCRDTADGHMRKAWFNASGQDGIPACFIVDAKGRIAWIGHPLSGLDEALPAVLEGTFNAKAFDAGLELEQRAYAFLFKKDYKAVLETAEKIDEAMPANADKKRILSMMALVHLDDARADRLYAQMAAAGQDLKDLGYYLYNVEGLPTKWYVRAITILEKVENWEGLGALATAQWRAGRKEEARATQVRCIARLKEMIVKNPELAGSYANLLKEAEADLRRFNER